MAAAAHARTVDMKAPIAKKQAALKMVERELKVRKAKDDLIHLVEMLFPAPDDPMDVSKTRYDVQPFHRALADALMAVERGDFTRLIICMPPRHGKSEIASKMFPAWFVGRDPYRHVMVASYNQPFANDFGKKVREIMQSEAFQAVFPDCKLKRGSQAVDRLETEQGGIMAFVGRGGSITGRGANLFVIDDPLKNSKEADSEVIRDELWTWYNNDVDSRGMDDTAPVIIIQTRWHEDDLVGRLTDPTNPHYNAQEAAKWKIVNIPALCENEDDPVEKSLGRKKGDPLWPWTFKYINGVKTVRPKFRKEWLEGKRRQEPRGFSALYQQSPSPPDGDLFKDEMIRFYRSRKEVPKRLKIYAASDHAVSESQRNDFTVLLIVGVDENDVIWLLDCWWQRAPTDVVVDQMILMMQKWKPITWYAEREHIVKSIGPFLRKRMREKKVYVYLNDKVSAHGADKEAKAQSIIGRMSMGMVMMPKFAGWYEKARTELLKFPRATHDDFVDALGLIGRALANMLTGTKAPEEKKGPEPGTWAFFKQQQKPTRPQVLRGM